MIDCEQYGDSTQLLYLRARHYSPVDGRFTSRDTWSGDVNRPLSLNRWNYTHSNPVNYTDPSGRCIITGVDTIVCIVALVVGIPIVAGVTTAAWDFALSQAGGLGAENWGQPECINWGQVASAGGSGAVAALEKLLAIPLAPNYLFAAWMGASPTEANAMLLSYVGLDDQYMNLQGNPYYVAGGYGGQASVNYISLAMLYNGLPSVNISSGLQMNGYNSLALSGYNITVSGGSAGLIYTGVAGMTSSSLMMSGNGGGGSGDVKLNGDLLRKLERRIKADGYLSIEDFKVPGGKGAGGYDLYVKPNGDIVIKPKPGIGPGESTGYNVYDL